MTRAERIEQLLINILEDAGIDDPLTLVTEVLAIADDRRLWFIRDFATASGRNHTTILSWLNRGQHDIPVPAYRTSNGMLWDADDIERWVREHPDLCPDAPLFT